MFDFDLVRDDHVSGVFPQSVAKQYVSAAVAASTGDIVATYVVVVVVAVFCGLGNNMESLQYGIWLVAATMPGEYVACSL